MAVNTAVESSMLIIGALFIEILGKGPDGTLYFSQQMCYIMHYVRAENTAFVVGGLQRSRSGRQGLP